MEPEIAIAWGEPPPGMLATKPGLSAILKAASDFASARNVEVQLFDAAAVVNLDHLRSAAMHAIRAKERGSMRASTLGMEMILYAAGRRQIREAVALVGLGDRTLRIAAVVVGPGASASASDLLSALECRSLPEAAAGGAPALERLNIRAGCASPGQLPDIVLEQVALLDTDR